MATILQSFNKNPNIGLYGFVTEKFALVGKEVNEADVKELERILEVPVHQITIAGTSLIGVFIVGDSDKILVPGIIFDSEKQILDKLKIKYEIFNTDLTCLGNNIVCNKNAALVNPEFSKEEQQMIADMLQVPVTTFELADTETPGSGIVINKDRAVVHRDCTRSQLSFIEETMDVTTYPGTINLGSPHIKSGVLVNSKGLVIGGASGPAEVMNCEEGFGFID